MTAVPTPVGEADVRLELPAGTPTALLLLGHGAGGGVDSADLAEVAAAALAAGYAVARVTQPYRVAGRRSPPRAPVLDEAWLAVAGQVRVDDLPLVVGGRSSGARVACRTADQVGAVAVVALAFPTAPPRTRTRTGWPSWPPRAGPCSSSKANVILSVSHRKRRAVR